MGTGSAAVAYPDTDPGQAQSVAAGEGAGAADEGGGEQRTGLIDRRAGAVRKRSCAGRSWRGRSPTWPRSAGGPRATSTSWGRHFQRKPSKGTYVGFLTASRTMQAEAEQHKAVLLKYGLSEPVLAQLGELLDRFDAAVLLGNNGRTAHKGATQQLEALAAELGSVVRTMDARNRQRFAGNAQLLASWVSASTVLGEAGGGGAGAGGAAPAGGEQGGTPAGGEVRPAA